MREDMEYKRIRKQILKNKDNFKDKVNRKKEECVEVKDIEEKRKCAMKSKEYRGRRREKKDSI